MGFPYIESVTNFITLIFNSSEQASNFTQALLHEGVIVRHLVAFGVPDCVRITIGNEEENAFFLEKLELVATDFVS
jgi:histidinol-phosphate aminotransferase